MDENKNDLRIIISVKRRCHTDGSKVITGSSNKIMYFDITDLLYFSSDEELNFSNNSVLGQVLAINKNSFSIDVMPLFLPDVNSGTSYVEVDIFGSVGKKKFKVTKKSITFWIASTNKNIFFQAERIKIYSSRIPT